MVLNPSNSSNLEQLVLKGLIPIPHVGVQGSKSGAQSVSWLEVVKGIPNQGVVSFVS